jgi:hypothetical protein
MSTSHFFFYNKISICNWNKYLHKYMAIMTLYSYNLHSSKFTNLAMFEVYPLGNHILSSHS